VRLRFLIPAYNEEGRIGRTLSALRSAFPGIPVLVIFDGNDDTPGVVGRFEGVELRSYPRRLGKGAPSGRGSGRWRTGKSPCSWTRTSRSLWSR
jgi:glycosyltransferase involved in cell wall biosynthesis